jgi:outer membrane protein TolC
VLWPALSASFSRSVTDDKEFPSARNSWSWSGLLSLPIFGGGPTAATYSVSAAERDLLKARENLRSARAEALSDIESSWSSFAGAVDQVKVASALLEAARQRNDEADISYNAGLLTYDNWEIIASDRINSERTAVQARLSAVTAEAAWEKSVGKLLGENK